MKNIVVLQGGNSPEREISLTSAKAVADELRHLGHKVTDLDPEDYPDLGEMLVHLKQIAPDLVFNALHGGYGENGEIQALLELTGFKFTGSAAKACVLTMDKYVCKLVVREEGIPVPDSVLMRYDMLADYNDPNDYQGFIDRLNLPLIVKPVDAGSSVGISLVQDIGQLKPAVVDAFRYCSSVLLEQYIPGRELTVTVLDGKALPIVEIKPLDGWYDFQNKYNKGRTEYVVPAVLDTASSELMQLYAERIFKAVGCSAYARVDFRYDGNKAWFLEVNTLPGMTSLSLTPMAARAAGMTFGDLLSNLITSTGA